MTIGDGMETGFSFVGDKPTSSEMFDARRRFFEASSAAGRIVNPTLVASQEGVESGQMAEGHDFGDQFRREHNKPGHEL